MFGSRSRPRSVCVSFSFSFLVVGGFVVGGCASCEGEPRFRPETPDERGAEAHGEVSSAAASGDPDLPGVARVDDALTTRLRAASSEAGHEHRFVNRLALEASPYLRQHAGNPVNWFPWGPEALARARALDRPIFLSIGYATCHWCHVMEVESFEDEEIARYLNEHFVCIKVDREERPDLDEIYMSAVQALTGRGGWPMTTVLMPDTLEPFFGGTYFPPRAGVRGSRMGLQEILRTLVQRFTDDREGARSEASALATRLRGMSRSRPSDTLPPPQAIGMAVAQLERSFHPVDGGFGGAPRFPQPSRLLLLLDHHARGGDARAQEVVDFTMERMAEGGIRDHVGGGFHRYATDARWRIPHFEKMLYDNAQLVIAFVEAWRASTTRAGRERYEALIHETLSYLTREMQHEGGAFFAATDADSRSAEGEMLEGAFFTWTRAEIESALGASAAGVFFARFDLEVDHELGDRGVLYAARSVADAATQAGMSETQLRESLTSSLSRLREVRAPRPAPSRDDAILAAWNGLVISALARAGFALEQETWVNEGVRAFDFIWSHMRDDEGRLIRSWVDGRTGDLAFADDHAALLEAALDLYEASGDARFLERATELFAALEAGFADAQTGAYFLSRESHEAPIARPAADDDGATPSATSMATRALLRLSELTGDDHAAERAQALLRATGDRLVRAPIAYPHLLLGLARAYASPREVAIVRPDADTSDAALLAVLRRTRAPHVLVRVHEAQIAPTSARVPWLSGKTAIDGRATAYVCEQGRCEAPTSDPRELAAQLARALE